MYCFSVAMAETVRRPYARICCLSLFLFFAVPVLFFLNFLSLCKIKKNDSNIIFFLSTFADILEPVVSKCDLIWIYGKKHLDPKLGLALSTINEIKWKLYDFYLHLSKTSVTYGNVCHILLKQHNGAFKTIIITKKHSTRNSRFCIANKSREHQNYNHTTIGSVINLILQLINNSFPSKR